MIMKVGLVQPVYDYYKHELYKPKKELNKKKATSFASVLENTIRSQAAGKYPYQ